MREQMGAMDLRYTDVEGLVLAGGTSERFGSDKASFEIGGKPMIHRVLDTMNQLVSPVRISIGHRRRSYGSQSEYIEDVYRDSGPMAGIHAGMAGCRTEWLLVVATDYAFVTEHALCDLLDHRSSDVSIVIPRDHTGRTQPLCACYRVGLLPAVQELLEDKICSMQALVDKAGDAVLVLNTRSMRYKNINYPGDL